MDKELALISGEFFEHDIAPEKRYLLKYFKPGIQRQFLYYYIVFGSYRYFADHSGWWCSTRWLKKLKRRLVKLEAVHQKARSEPTDENFELLEKLEAGKYKVRYE